MPEFTVTQRIAAPIERVWAVLDDFGDIARWNPGVAHSELISEGPVGEGSTRHCDFTPMGGVDERIVGYETGRRLTIDLYKTYRLPIARAQADFELEGVEGGTDVTLRYSYIPNLAGIILHGMTDRQLRKGLGALVTALRAEAEGGTT